MFCKYTSLIICWIILKVTLCLHFPINEKSYLWQFFKTYCLFVGLHSTRIETLLQNLTYAWNSVRLFLVWHTYNGQWSSPRSVKHAPVVERLSVELSQPTLTTWVWRDWGSNPDHPHSKRTLYH